MALSQNGFHFLMVKISDDFRLPGFAGMFHCC